MAPNGSMTGATNLNGPTWPSTTAIFGGGVFVVYRAPYVTCATGYHRAPEPVGLFRDAADERRSWSRAKAVPPTSLPGNAEDRVAPLAHRDVNPGNISLAPAWLSSRRGAPRERTCRRSRHRPRTWERDGTTTP